MKKVQITKIEEITPITGLNCAEQETSLYFAREDDLVTVSTTDNTFLTKMKKLMEKNPKDYTGYALYNNAGEVDSYTFTFPKNFLSLRTVKKEVSEEQREASSERFKKMWEGRK